VPAAAVIPAPIAYIKVVAVKKLVVGFQHKPADPFEESGGHVQLRILCWQLNLLHCVRSIYFEEIRVFQAGFCLEYISME
jgi:hypothetical protein